MATSEEISESVTTWNGVGANSQQSGGFVYQSAGKLTVKPSVPFVQSWVSAATDGSAEKL
jgi:hypothetical protein